MKRKEKYINVGTILIENTCDAINLGFNGKSKRVNEHQEHWLVEEVRKEGFKLYNLDTQRKRIISRGELNISLRFNWEISDEKA